MMTSVGQNDPTKNDVSQIGAWKLSMPIHCSALGWFSIFFANVEGL